MCLIRQYAKRNNEIKLMISKNEITLFAHYEGRVLKLLIDTGAQLSFIKRNIFSNLKNLNAMKAQNISGVIANSKCSTLGTITMKLQLNNEMYQHNFHVINHIISLEMDGVIGSDFLIKFKGKIDYLSEILELQANEMEGSVSAVFLSNGHSSDSSKDKGNCTRFSAGTSVQASKSNVVIERGKGISPLGRQKMQEFNSNTTGSRSDEYLNPMGAEKGVTPRNKFRRLSREQPIILKARTENIIEIDTIEKEELVIQKKKLADGVYVANSIATPSNNCIKIAILNASEEDFPLRKEEFNVKITKLSDYNMIQENQNKEIKEKRMEKLAKLLDLSHCNEEEYREIWKIFEEFHEVFHLEGDRLTLTPAAIHKIPLIPGTQPITTKPHRVPYYQKADLDKEISRMLEDEIIQPSKSPWCSPILLVPKKSDESGKKRWRLCMDFRKVNEKTISDMYPIPSVLEIIESLSDAEFYSSVDLEKGYWQVGMEEQDRELTAFKANGKLYEWLRMPMGVKGASATFQRMMNNVLTGLNGEICFVYIDDVVIFGKTLKIHNERLIQVLQRLKEYKLKIKPEKCSLLKREIKFLGHIISPAGVEADPKKVEAVKNFPIPRTQKDVKKFLGLSGFYRKFIVSYAKTCRLLYPEYGLYRCLLTNASRLHSYVNAYAKTLQLSIYI